MEIENDFDGYFEATEQSFAAEKEEMLYKIDGLGALWETAVKLDEEAIMKCHELMKLKKILSKGHLQILRTREEALIMELKNAQLRFQVRQLQSEIFRLLPYSHSYVPSTEYHMSLDQNLYRETAKIQVEADPEHLKDLEYIHAKWANLCQIQKEVFDEEIKKQQEDSDQWNKFALDFESQNHDAHRTIDAQLGEITRKLVDLKSTNDDLVSTKTDQLESLERKLKRLKGRAESTLSSLSEKSIQERSKARVDASQQCNIVRGRVREIERKNLARFSAMKEKDNELQERELSLLRANEGLNEKVRKLNQKNNGLAAEGNARIRKLEEQLNAVISAAAAIEDCTDIEEHRIIEAVSTAVGKHARSAMKVEKIYQEIGRMNNRLEQMANVYDVRI
ncbi:hypothetical protein TRFO_32988 [Tritrichomonas foetus]|uniref:Uncharacterized protein n=1 Tax=Tritrichomonas foetus TaxID=1144522 RepID=A0A1J4JMP6_9EUKA|nr:hypothetical protein TRFO_32988 [Tritrichomonas foetus]|eukprot:OHT00391.1 hypothetical protein TRFO_32988 [Tritrichomonas foetus]